MAEVEAAPAPVEGAEPAPAAPVESAEAPKDVPAAGNYDEDDDSEEEKIELSEE
jgi:hypothetical protein